jgi:threonine/homoserine/homoserine lactone efflux protein
VTAALFQAMAIALGGALSVGQILLTLLLLGGEGGAKKAAAYCAGMTGTLLVLGQGALFIGQGVATRAEDSGPGAAAWVSLVLGAVMLFFAAKTWRTPAPDEPKPPRLFAAIDGASPGKLLGVGALVGLINVKNLAIYFSAVGVVIDARLPRVEGAVSVLATTLVFTLCVSGPLLLYVVGRARAEPSLRRLRELLERHNRPVVVTVLLVLGTVFFARGLYLVTA